MMAVSDDDDDAGENKETIHREIRFHQLQTFIAATSNEFLVTRIKFVDSEILKIEDEKSYYNYGTFFKSISCFIEPQRGEETFLARLVTASGKVIALHFFQSEVELDEILRDMKEYRRCMGENDDFLLKNLKNIKNTDFFLIYIENFDGDDDDVIIRSRDCKYFEKDLNEDGKRPQCAACRELFRNISNQEQVKPGEEDQDDDVKHGQIRKNRKNRFKCTECGLGFRYEKIFRNHNIDVHHKDLRKVFECSDCKLSFRYEKSFQNHLFHVHKKGLNGETISLVDSKCPLCGESFGSSELEKHRRLAHPDTPDTPPVDNEDNQHKCEECGRSFKFLKTYIKHQRIVHGVNVGEVGGEINKKIEKRCYFCPRRFTRLGKLARHLKLSHPEQDLSQCEEVKLHNPKASKVCDVCGNAVRNLSRHKENTHSEISPMEPCQVCGRMIKRTSMHGHMLSHNQKTFLCSDCGQGFAHRSYLERHSRIHDPEYKCLPCKYCGKMFGRIDSLNKHLKSTHLDQRDYICQVCGKGFVCKSKLTRHHAVHSNRKGYPCEVCSYQCSRLDNLNVHRLKSHGLEKTTTAKVRERFSTDTNSKN